MPPKELQAVFGPIGVAEERHVRLLGDTEVDAQATRRAVFEHDLGVFGADGRQQTVIALVVAMQAVARAMPMVGAIAAGTRVEVEVELDPIGAVVGDEPVEGGKRPGPAGITGQTDVAAGGVVAPCHDGRVGESGFGADAERFDFAPQTKSHALGMHIIGQGTDAAGEAGRVDDVPVAAIVVPVGARV